MRRSDQALSSAGWTDYGGANDTPYGPRLSSYFLHTQEWREAFLERLVAIGEPGLFEAAARVYDLLAEPKGYYCAMIAQAAKVTGSGKLVILKVLKAFLDEWLQPLGPLSAGSGAKSLEDWHVATMQAWVTENERERWVVMKFAAALNGDMKIGGQVGRGRNVMPFGFWQPRQ